LSCWRYCLQGTRGCKSRARATPTPIHHHMPAGAGLCASWPHMCWRVPLLCTAHCRRGRVRRLRGRAHPTPQAQLPVPHAPPLTVAQRRPAPESPSSCSGRGQGAGAGHEGRRVGCAARGKRGSASGAAPRVLPGL